MDLPRLIRTSITTGELTPSADLVAGINDGSIQLLEMVKALADFLTSTEDGVRLKGLTFLSNVVKSISPGKINRQATLTLSRFFISSLDDFDSLPPSLNALIVLSRLPTMDSETTIEVYRAVCENVNMRAYVQATRHLVYQLFDSMLASHRGALKSMGSDFLNSYVKMVDGEKDPRNLMLLFSMDRVILLEFDIKDVVEDFFDIVFCYFPISFRPPPNDPYGITADDLKSSLRHCLSATPLFAKMALPLYIEKFATATPAMMKDLMLTMAACFPVYGQTAVSERGTELWECIKMEINYQSDKEIEKAATEALESLILTIYPTAQDSPIGLAQEIIKESLKALEEPDKALSLAATKTLVALFTASPGTGPYTVAQALPQLFRSFNHPSLPAHRTPILWSITSLLIAAAKIYSQPDSLRQYSVERPFEQFRTALMDTLREGLRTDGLKEAAARGCVALSEIPGMWSRSEVELVVGSMNDIVLKEESADVRDAVVKGLVAMAKLHSPVIESTTLPLLFHALPERSPAVTQSEARDNYRSVLASLAELCFVSALFETLLIRILSKLDTLATTTDKLDDDQRECEIAYAYDLLNTVRDVVERKLSAGHPDVAKRFETLVPRILRLAVEAASPRIGDVQPIWRDRRLLILTGNIVDQFVWEMPADRQTKYFASVHAAFERGEMGGIVSGDVAWTAGSPLRTGAPAAEQNLIVILSVVVQALKPETQLPFESLADFVSQLTHWTVHVAQSDFQVRQALDLLSALVNKRVNDIEHATGALLERLWVGDVQDTSKDFEVRRRALHVYLQITKALALIRHAVSYTAVERILDILKLAYFDPNIVGEAARGLSIVANGRGKANGKGKVHGHLTAKLLWAQKMWNFALPKIVEGDSEARGQFTSFRMWPVVGTHADFTGRDRLVYLTAFASLLPLVPASLLLTDLANILPLMLRSLALPGPDERKNAMTSLESIFETPNLSSEVDQILHKQAESIVDGLLKSVTPTADMASSPAVRAAALRCLAAIPDVIRFEKLAGHKSSVLRDLGKALDDPVRIVRREAVDCRAKWFGYK